MALSNQDVQRVAFLSRLELTDKEIEKFKGQMEQVLEYITVLNELDTSNVEPTFSVTGTENRLREDTEQQSLSQQEALQNAHHKTNQYFLAPYVFE